MFAKLKSGRCGQMSVAAVMIGQALIWAGVTIAVALELRGSPAAESVVMWLSTGAFCSLLLASGLTSRSRRDDRDAS